jgi:hypothetical protein
MFKVTGVSRCKDAFKVRFANDMSRVKVLVKTGHDEITLVEMPEALDKSGCVQFLKTSALYERSEYRAAIDAADVKYNGSSVVKVAKPKSGEPNLDEIKSRVSKKVVQPQETESVEV